MDKRTELYNKANTFGIKILSGKSSKDKLKKAVHLLTPTFEELDDAIEQCLEENLNEIYVYTKDTWVTSRRNQLFNY